MKLSTSSQWLRTVLSQIMFLFVTYLAYQLTAYAFSRIVSSISASLVSNLAFWTATALLLYTSVRPPKHASICKVSTTTLCVTAFVFSLCISAMSYVLVMMILTEFTVIIESALAVFCACIMSIIGWVFFERRTVVSE